MKKIIIAAGLIVAISMMFSGCATYSAFYSEFIDGSPQREDTVRIGVFQAMTGSDSVYASEEIKGIELAHELMPEALGKPVELIYEDNKGESIMAEVAAKNLVEKRVAVVLGSYGSTVSLVGGEIFEAAEIPAIGATCNNALVTSASAYYARVCFVNTFEGTAMAKYAYENLNASTAAVIYEGTDSFSTAVAQAFVDKFQIATGNEYSVTSMTKYNEGDTRFTTQLDHIMEQNPDVVFLPGDIEESGLIMRELRARGSTAEFLGLEKHEDERLFQYAGDAANGLYLVTSFDPDSSITETTDLFIGAYKRKYGQDAVPSSAAALGFDSYLFAVESINKAGTALDGPVLIDIIRRTKQFQGATGEMSYDRSGDPIKSAVVKTVENNKFIFKEIIVPTWG